jgi:predicted lipid-binding transport protein (Tim44 family)
MLFVPTMSGALSSSPWSSTSIPTLEKAPESEAPQGDSMTEFTPVSATIGGMTIGLAAGLLLLLRGRIAGISGILGFIALALVLSGGAWYFCHAVKCRGRNDGNYHGGGIDRAPIDVDSYD